ncbi:MAG: hypothetical protein ACTSW3_10015, partial [Promethearchaeota archaeon]
MLTFINSFSDGGGNFVAFLQIDDYLDVVQNASKTLDPNTVAIFYLLAAVFSIVSLIALLAVLVVFVMRLIYLWIYVVLSPLAFLMMAFPDGQKYASQYWGDLIKYLINGPVLAFFIWLALSTLNKISEMPFTAPIQELTGVTEISQGANFMSFVLAIGFLVGGLMMSSQIGGMGASWGSGMVSKVKNTGIGWSKKSASLGWKGTKGLSDYGARKFAGWEHGFEIRPGKIMAGMKASMDRHKLNDELAVQQQGGKLLNKGGLKGVLGGWGAGSDAADRYFTGFLNLKGFRNMKNDWKGGNVKAKLLEEAKEKQEEFNDMEGITTSERDAYKEEHTQKEKEFKEIKEQISEKAKDSESHKEGTEEHKEFQDLVMKKDAIKKEMNEIKIKANIEPSVDKDKLEEDLKGIVIKIKKINLPKSFEARAAYMKQKNEEKSKLQDVTNAAELEDLYNDAADKKDKIRMAAIAEKLFNDKNGNELLNNQGYESNAIGLHKFIQEKMVGEAGMTQEEALQVQNDLSEAAERANHWEMAKTVGVNEYGELTSLIKKRGDGTYDDTKHAEAAAAEIFKMDPQMMLRNLNRLAFGGEDPKNNREFKVSTLGLTVLKGREKDFLRQSDRMLANVAFNLASVEEKLEEAGIGDELRKIIRDKGMSDGEINSPGHVIKKLKNDGLT